MWCVCVCVYVCGVCVCMCVVCACVHVCVCVWFVCEGTCSYIHVSHLHTHDMCNMHTLCTQYSQAKHTTA